MCIAANETLYRAAAFPGRRENRRSNAVAWEGHRAVLRRRRFLIICMVGVVLVGGFPPADGAALAAGRILKRASIASNKSSSTSKPAQPTTKPTTKPAKFAPPATLDACRQAYMRGRYSDAIAGYRKYLAADANSIPAAIGLAEALNITGKYAAADAVLDAAATPGRENADWQVAKAEGLTKIGKYSAALDHARQATELDPNNAEAILLQGMLLETLGRRDEAIATYKQMERIIEAGRFRRDAEALVALGRILDRYAVLTGRRASDQATNILHNYFQTAYQKVDPKYWPAHVAAGMFLLSKHKAAGAASEFALAAKINPHLPDVHAGRAALLLGKWQFEKCLAEVKKALKINPHHDLALYLRAVCYMQWRKFEKAPRLLEQILATNPNDLDALSLTAAAYIRMDQPEKAEPFIARVKKINPRCVRLPQTIGQWLIAGRQFRRAEKYLTQAVALSPKTAGPLAALGKMYMQTGEEDKALEVLRRAHSLDDFRQDVVHYLNIAKKLEGFAVKETDHFIVKVDPRYDMVLLDIVSDYMESIYPEVTGDHEYCPKAKTIVEILPFQKDFSARISGRGWIPTVGACTGNVIAIAAPNRKRGVLGLHNWAQVLRHEFTHTVTLEITDNRIPHWFTEACAVWQQKDKRAFRYIQTLVAATQSGRLFPVEQINWGFIRPKRRGDRTLAYAQAEWMMDYIIQSRGFETINRMLRAFGDGLSQKDVFRKVLGVSEKQFDKEFRAWAAKVIEKEWGFDSQPWPTVKNTAKKVKADPDNPDAQARYALALLKARRYQPAQTAAGKALRLKEDHSLALRVMANLYYIKKDYAKAITTCRKLEAADPTTATGPRILARCHITKKDWARAIGELELLQKRRPLDSFSYIQLAKIYVQLGQPEKALPELIYLHKHTMNDPKYARQIAEIYRSLNRPASALKYFREVTYINPYESSAYEGMAAIYLHGKQYNRARAAARSLTLLAPKSAKSWNYLAMIDYRAGKAAGDLEMLKQARQTAEKAKKLDPKNHQAEHILQLISAAAAKLEKNKNDKEYVPATQPE